VFYNAGSVVRRTGGVSSCRSQTIVRRSGHIGRLSVRSCVEYLSNKWLRQQILECADLSALLTKAPHKSPHSNAGAQSTAPLLTSALPIAITSALVVLNRIMSPHYR